ncbi:hypothetical protein GS982_01475 [Rhodococcus hoagii]|uniref:Uncharacterized protein n=1 Tax=Rhodococcus hoagii TaxID=43767 RepID=A0A9Q5EZ64_RHOHA|nr:hypothetical protein [Prescottella equi]NKT77268.1 hypothetical protein [Prescottella equi]NKZ81054.1 hypothetical protein [Prescottella equi]
MGVVVLTRTATQGVSLVKKVSLIKHPVRAGDLQPGDLERIRAFHTRNGR